MRATVMVLALCVLCPGCGGVHAVTFDSADTAAAADAGAADAFASPDAQAPADAGCQLDASAPGYPVGVTTRLLVDPSRSTPPNGTAPGTQNRSLNTDIWYPATGDPAAAEIRDALPELTGAPYPLVLFVHGSSAFRRSSTFLTQALARAGYVVAAADFPLTCINTPGGSSDWHVEDQPGDLSFLATTLFDASSTPGDLLAGALDASRGYAVVGHSTGGTVALLAGFAPDAHDDRVRAVVSISGDCCFFGDSFFSTRATPLLLLTASRDLLVPPPSNAQRAYRLAGPPKAISILLGGTHLGFTDLDLPDDIGGSPTTTRDPLAQTLSAYGGGTSCESVPPPADDPAMTFIKQHRLTVTWTRAFLDTFLRAAPQDLTCLEARSDPWVTTEHE